MFGLKGGLVYKVGLKYTDIFPALFIVLKFPVFKTSSMTEEEEGNDNPVVSSEQEGVASVVPEDAASHTENKEEDLFADWELI